MELRRVVGGLVWDEEVEDVEDVDFESLLSLLCSES